LGKLIVTYGRKDEKDSIFLICSTSITSGLQAKNKDVIKIVTETGYKPFVYADGSVRNEVLKPNTDSKQMKGLAWEIVREAFHAVGKTISISGIPWSRAVQELENGKSDILFPAAKNEKRLKIYNFSDTPIIKGKVTIITLKEKPIKWDEKLSSLNTILANKKIGTVRGYIYGTWWDERHKNNKFNFKTIEVNKDEQNIKKIKSGRIDAF